MSRVHNSRPWKSNALRMPVPVITHTDRPSVTGDGDDMFCFIIFVLPPPSRCFQTAAPRMRSTHHRNRSDPSATLRKMRSPQTMGVEPENAGRASFHVMLVVFDHCDGRLLSALT